MFDVTQVRAIAAREHDWAIRLLAAARDEDFTLASRCAGWSVGDVAAHLGRASTQQAEAYRRAIKGLLDPPEYPGAPDLPPAEVRNVLRAGAAAMAASVRPTASARAGRRHHRHGGRGQEGPIARRSPRPHSPQGR